MNCDIEGRKHKCDRAEQLDQHVQRWACGILERIADGIANYTGLVRLAFLTQNSTFRIETANHLAFSVYAQVASLDILLGVVPRAAAIVQEEGKYDTAHGANHQHSCLRFRAKDDTYNNGGQYGDEAGQNHSAECATSADVNAAGVVW